MFMNSCSYPAFSKVFAGIGFTCFWNSKPSTRSLQTRDKIVGVQNCSSLGWKHGVVLRVRDWIPTWKLFPVCVWVSYLTSLSLIQSWNILFIYSPWHTPMSTLEPSPSLILAWGENNKSKNMAHPLLKISYN